MECRAPAPKESMMKSCNNDNNRNNNNKTRLSVKAGSNFEGGKAGGKIRLEMGDRGHAIKSLVCQVCKPGFHPRSNGDLMKIQGWTQHCFLFFSKKLIYWLL